MPPARKKVLMIKKEEFTFDSRDGKTKIHAVRWIPEGKIICILQIVHGMAEYIERYEETAEYLAGKGILVTGEDHLGHGKSVSEDVPFGYFCAQDPATVAVRDVHRLKKMTQEAYPGIPYVILGHSLGTFMLRNYLFRYGTGIQGVILCGTGHTPQPLIRFGMLAAQIQRFIMGDKYVSGMLDKLAFGSYLNKIPSPRTKYDWLATDEAVIDRYLADPLCGFGFTVNGFRTMFELIIRQNKASNLMKMPKELPVMFLSGADDPVGNYQKGVETVHGAFLAAGMQKVSLKFYENNRHEILNDPNREQVYEDIVSWILERVKEYQI